MAWIKSPPTLRRVPRVLHRNLPPINFITIHYIYFIGTCLLSALIFWGASTPSKSVRFIDALFLCVSAMTLAGLNTVNLSTLNTFQQIELFFLIMLGSAIFVSAFVVHVRKRAFEHKFAAVVEKDRQRRERAKSSGHSMSRSLVRRLSMSFSRSDNRLGVPGKSIRASENHDSITQEKAPGALDNSSTLDMGSNLQAEKDGLSPQAQDQSSATQNGLTRRSSAVQTLPGSVQSAAETFRMPTTASDSGSPLDHNSSSNPTEAFRRQSRVNSPSTFEDAITDDASPDHISFGPDTLFRTFPADSGTLRHHRILSMQGVGAHSDASIKLRTNSQTNVHPDVVPESFGIRARRYIPFTSSGRLSRNSQFHGLSEAQREHLGGCEYRAIQLLSWVVPLYFILFQLLGCLGIGAYVANNKASVTERNGLNPWWVGSFNAVSAFNNSGMSLLDANMVAFQTSIYMLITMGLLILAGNTCYPIFLRLIVWVFYKLVPNGESWSETRKTLKFLLDHPRRCYTNLFPAQHTWWLLVSVVALNGIDWLAFEVLNIGNDAITSLPAGMEVIDGLFQALAVRSGGFYVVPIPNVRISLQVLYVVMMYISVYPVVITMRNSNVYEERSLGIYSDDPGYDAVIASSSFFSKLRRTITGKRWEQRTSYFVRQQLRAQLAHDAWWIVLAIFLIMIIEGSQFERNPAIFSVFNVIFEVVSGYGCVGISVGLPNEAYSFCGSWHTLSKLILCAVMLRGRHRGLPVAIDKAVLLPGEGLHQAEEEDAQIRMERTISRGTAV
ncbi:TrkH-domain-containing protein [Mytilinidion resinicola]|uniref:Potassium transport protein n=1 Tax=Mytilinidion resinicola TaxID=574789 RepID=A0A6A6YWH7_9PEZI|nr:TrkH-domain-containing protein [Mytilinidion resinicola]KAF2813151.1 TrkH-domain-containing protein [Mytilinidion resinicola]